MEESSAKSGLAIAGLVISIVALVLSAVPIINNFAFVLALISLVLGVVAIVGAKKKNRKIGMAVAVIVLSVVAGGIVLGSQAFYGKAIDEVDKGINEAFSDKTEENLRDKVSVDFGEFTVTKDEFGLKDTVLPVTITNKSDEKINFLIDIEAVSPDGDRVGQDTVHVSNLGPKQSQKEKAFTFVSSDDVEALKSATFKVSNVD